MGSAARVTPDELKVRLGDLVLAVSGALDLMDPAISEHHLRVTAVAHAIGKTVGLPDRSLRDLVLAASLHDCGAFSLRERLGIMDFEIDRPHEHAAAGFRLLRRFPHFAGAASIVRFHHVPWESRRGEQHDGALVPLESHIVHLADRVSVLVRPGADLDTLAAEVRKTIRPLAGVKFAPKFVEAFCDLAASRAFWEIVAHPGRLSPTAGALDGEFLGSGDLRGLERLFWQLIDFRSPYTATHTAGVAEVAEYLAGQSGLAAPRAAQVGIAAGLHDIGKLAVPPEIIDKERELTRTERATVRAHPYHGYRVLAGIPGLQGINSWASFHHERLDGSGYPFHLPAGSLPLESRVVAVADVFTALTEERPYRRGMSGREAVGIVERMAREGALDGGVAAIAAGRTAELQTVRRQAQARAGRRFLAFREQQLPAAEHDAA